MAVVVRDRVPAFLEFWRRAVRPEFARWSTTRASDELRAVLGQFSDQADGEDGQFSG
jgi:hypothetical protein